MLIIDMINDLDFPGGGSLLPKALAAGESILRLREQADRLAMPVVYVNDNYGHWRSERSSIIEACRETSHGRALVEQMAPRDTDYFVVKPQFSGFYATTLQVLLPKLGVSRLVLTGIAADMCVLFTAADGHMRDYSLWTPHDAVASLSDERCAWALEIMRAGMGAETRPTSVLTLRDWCNADPR
ncbi:MULTISPECIES: isochorismatase family cysteine hydrolase [unclassified Phenylobacterium]|uniref:isochorismatase family cysteine hydrolase n=1 Tax=unclassified Phenylobacterium TaxID=2640670 RepID=UPI001910041C|nr:MULTISPECIES: isochorismatase family cysteine hydrolase [unclassified Phenylobacterium]